MSCHVRITLPNHREAPGQTVYVYNFEDRAKAERYATEVRTHRNGIEAGGWFDAQVYDGCAEPKPIEA